MKKKNSSKAEVTKGHFAEPGKRMELEGDNHLHGLQICPPSPELEKRILHMKDALLTEAGFEGIDEVDMLDMRTFSLITTRPKATRDHDSYGEADKSPTIGVKRAIVLLVDFSDKAATTAQTHYNELLFSVGSYATGSMRDYYREVSYNQLDVQGSVAGSGGPTAGWFRVPQTKAYYTDGNFGFNAYPRNAQKLVEDAIDLANPFVNFSQYDNDGDGFVEALIVICAGTGAEVSGNAGDFWSHKWGIAPKTVDGVKINRYFMAPEDGRVGVMAHELGHLLCGLPDLYDTDYSSRGTGSWDLMAGGSWNNGGNTPAHPTAWCKMSCGWLNPTVIFNREQDVTLRPYTTHKDVYKLPIGSTSSKEFFLISNRQKSGFDRFLPGDGMIIEHVDENRTNNQVESHYLVDIEQADGRRDLNNNTNSGDATDSYPISGNNAFTRTSTPNSRSYSGNDSKVSITQIRESGTHIRAKLNVGGDTVKKWVYNTRILRTFASPHSKNAWAYIEHLGWRKAHPLAQDGVTNCFLALNEAFANNRRINVYLDNQFLYQVYF